MSNGTRREGDVDAEARTTPATGGHNAATRWQSLSGVIVIQSQNAFNDNLVRFILISLALAVARGTPVGDNIEFILSVLLPIPYVILAPVAGYFADRFSKRAVMGACLIGQVILFTWIAACVYFGSLPLAVVGFFLLSVQSTFFSPAKLGILKEIVGSSRLGMATGLMQMTTMLAILGGMFIAGRWFDFRFTQHGDPWSAALHPIAIIGVGSLVPLALLWLVRRTPAHPGVRFRKQLFWSHFIELRYLLGHRKLRLPALAIAFYWLVAYFMGVALVGFAREQFPDPSSPGAARLISNMTAIIGAGLMIGSLLVAWISRRRIQLGLIPLGGIGLAAALLGTGLSGPGSTAFYAWLSFIGFAGAFFVIPLTAHLQDIPEDDHRGRVLAANNLLTALSGVIAVTLGFAFTTAGISPSSQVLVFVVPALLVCAYSARVMPHHTLRILILALFRLIYRVRTLNAGRLPSTGGALLICNHISFIDALIVGFVARREVRFMIAERFTRKPWLGWFLRVFAAIPVDPRNIRNTMRAAAKAIRDGDLVCLFPEGQLTRTGMLNEMKKGYQLIASEAGAPVIPVYLDGLWGSIFSFELGRFISKWPRPLPYRVVVNFAEPLSAAEASPETVRETLQHLAGEALPARDSLALTLPKALGRALQRYPWRTAVIDRTGKRRKALTRANLLATSLALAARWRCDGAFDDHETSVGILLPHGAPAIVFELALVFAGRTPVVCSLEHTPDRELMNVAAVHTMISTKKIRARLPGFPWPEGFLDMTAALQSLPPFARFARWARFFFLPFVPARFPDRRPASTAGGDGDGDDDRDEPPAFVALAERAASLSRRDLLANVEQIRGINFADRDSRILGQAGPETPGGAILSLWYPLLAGHPIITVSVAAGDRLVASVAAEENVTRIIARPELIPPDPGDHCNWSCPLVRLHAPDSLLACDSAGRRVLHGLADAGSGRVISLSIPDPEASPPAHAQPGSRDGSFGRLLPGISLEQAQVILGLPLRADTDGFIFTEASAM